MRVTVVGGAAWNRMIHVERLPDGRGATIHPLWRHEAIRGSAAGKAMNLARLGVAVTLHAGIGDDEPGRRVTAGLKTAGVDLRATVDPGGTAQHVNLMDPTGGRISIMLANGSPDLPFDVAAVAQSMRESDVVVVDLAPWTPRALQLAAAAGRPTWTDLHDYDGSRDWHIPFIDAAEVVFVSHDRLPEPVTFLESLIDRGKHLAVCTMAAAGAIALDADRHHTRSRPSATWRSSMPTGPAMHSSPACCSGCSAASRWSGRCATARSRAGSPSRRRSSRPPISRRAVCDSRPTHSSSPGRAIDDGPVRTASPGGAIDRYRWLRRRGRRQEVDAAPRAPFLGP